MVALLVFGFSQVKEGVGDEGRIRSSAGVRQRLFVPPLRGCGLPPAAGGLSQVDEWVDDQPALADPAEHRQALGPVLRGPCIVAQAVRLDAPVAERKRGVRLVAGLYVEPKGLLVKTWGDGVGTLEPGERTRAGAGV